MSGNTWAITLRPPFVEKVVSGVKAYEIRTRLPRDFDIGDEVFVVQAETGGEVVLVFRVCDILIGTPRRMWELYKRGLGISESEFFFYTAMGAYVYLIKMENVKRLEPSWTLEDLQLRHVPQWIVRVNVVRRSPHSAALMPEKSALGGR